MSLLRQFSLESKYIKFSWMFIETKVDILHQQVTKDKQYIYTADNEKLQPQFGVLKTLKQVSFPLVSYIGHIDCLAFESIWKKRKVEICVGLKEM